MNHLNARPPQRRPRVIALAAPAQTNSHRQLALAALLISLTLLAAQVLAPAGL